MSTANNTNAFDPKAIYETYERAANGWFDTWSKSPAFLAAMGKTLEAQLGMKSGMDRAVEQWCEAWRIPTHKDMESLAAHVAELEGRVVALEEALGEPAVAGASMSEKR
jgi:hypothetical protein